MINAVILAGIADYIAGYFSRDARYWPSQASASQPIAVRWVAGDDEPAVRALVNALRERTASPYRSQDYDDSLSIVTEEAKSGPTAVITFWLDFRPHDGPGVRYELEVPGTSDIYPGWFSVAAT